MRRLLVWVGVETLVVLLARTIVYALSPSPLALHFEHAAGGPRLPIVSLVAVALGFACSTAVVWLAATGVAERRLLSEEPLVRAPRLDVGRAALRAVMLFATSCVSFALVESTIHWREGLGWHGLACLLGPVHRNAIPVLAALSLVAAAVAAAVGHVVAWMRRTIARLRATRLRSRPSRTCRPHPLVVLTPALLVAVVGARPPPFAG